MEPALVLVDQLTREAHELAPLSPTAARLCGLLGHEEWQLEDLVNAVQLDQALTGRLLGAANSVWSGARAPVVDVEHAIMRLGPGTLLALAVGSSVGTTLRQSVPAYGLNEGELWRHSVAAALTMQHARPYCRVPVEPQGFVAALLHDVGKLVLGRHVSSEAAQRIRQTTQEAGAMLEAVEEQVLGTTHAEVGALVARLWGLPDSIITGIRYHHAPLSAPTERGRRLCYQICLSDAVAEAVGQACIDSGGAAPLSPAIAGRLGIPRERFSALVAEVSEEIEDVLASYA